jgi:glycosyltransferase involved in cell wall biosynthesis
MPARVAIATTYYRPVLGGAESAAERLATFLQRRGHHVVVLTKRTSAADPTDEELDGVQVVRLPPVGERRASGKWIVLPWMFRALMARREKFDAICCIDYRGIGVAALGAGWRTGKPVIFQAQTEGVLSGMRVRAGTTTFEIEPASPIKQLATWPIRALYRRADAIGCISRGIEREALTAGVPRQRVHYLPNPVDTRRFSPATPEDRRTIRRQIAMPPDTVAGLFVGRLSREKGLIELLHAWAQARPPAQLYVIGPAMPGHAWDVSGPARELVESHGMTNVVHFLGGQPRDAVAQWLRASDFAVQPSHFEAMGLAAAEAMAAGLPVIATDTSGYRDFVTTGETGLVVPVGDIGALASAIARLAADADLRARLGRQARARAEEFDERVVLEQFARLIDELAGL